MSIFSQAKSSVGGMMGSFYKSDIAQQGVAWSKKLATATSAASAEMKYRAKDTWQASNMLGKTGLTNIGAGVAGGAAVGAGSAYLNNDDVGRGAVKGGLLGAVGGAATNIGIGAWKTRNKRFNMFGY